jgi:hypothetical protein
MAEPAEANAFPSASLLVRSGNPVYGAAGNTRGFKKSKITYREDSLQQATGYSSIILIFKRVVMVAGFVNIGTGCKG